MMDDMTAFERQVAARLELIAGPEPHVDAMASARTAMSSASTRRNFTMFSALKLMVAGVIVALFGGFLLTGVLTTQQGDEMAPAAVTASPEPVVTTATTEPMGSMDADPEAVYFTATAQLPEVAFGMESEGERLWSSRDGIWTLEAEASDPRASGTMTGYYNADVDIQSGHGIQWGSLRIENAGGTWVGPYTGMEYQPPEGDFMAASSMLVGDGDYAGYAMYLQLDINQFGPLRELHGVIFRGEPPAIEVISDAVKIVVAKQDAGAGYVVMPAVRGVSAAEVSPDVFTDPTEIRGRRAAVDIPAGTPITPDLLEPAE